MRFIGQTIMTGYENSKLYAVYGPRQFIFPPGVMSHQRWIRLSDIYMSVRQQLPFVSSHKQIGIKQERRDINSKTEQSAESSTKNLNRLTECSAEFLRA